MSTTIEYEFHNTSVRKFTNVQSLIFFNLMGRLTFEHSLMFGNRPLLVIVNRGVSGIWVNFFNVNINLIEGYLKELPLNFHILTDNNAVTFDDLETSCRLLIRDVKMGIRKRNDEEIYLEGI